MTINLLLHTLTATTPVNGECIVYWQNKPVVATASSKLIDATPLTLEQIWPLLQAYRDITLVGIDILVPLKSTPTHQVVAFIRALEFNKTVTVVLNSDDALRSGDQEVLLKTLAHAAERITALRDLPSGRDKEYAGMARFTHGSRYNVLTSEPWHEGQRLYKYRENMMAATFLQ